jgi:hypothetical protein
VEKGLVIRREKGKRRGLYDILRIEESHKVLLITEADYDGRMGGDEFAKAFTQAREPLPDRVDGDTEKLPLVDLLQ